MDKNKFGNYVKEKRILKGYTQKQLADLLNIDVSAVSKWERGVTYPDITLIPEICKNLDVSEHELIESSNDTFARTAAEEARKYKKLKDGIFYTLSVCYLVTVVTCFTVNLAVSGTLSWFFIVLASCLCAFTFVPSVLRFFKKLKFPIYLITTFVSLFLLFLTCSIYTGNYWVFVATSGTLLFYFAAFAPILLVRQKAYTTEKRYNSQKRFYALIYTLGLFYLTVLTLFSVSRYTDINLTLAMKITAYCFLLPLLISFAEMLPLSRMVKLGIDSVITGLHLYGLNGVMNLWLDGSINNCYKVDLSNWGKYTNGNVAITGLTFFTLLGIVLLVFGLIKKKTKIKHF